MRSEPVVNGGTTLEGVVRCLVALVVTAVLGHATAALAGTIRPFSYHSEALGTAQTAQVYVPDGASPPSGWPVLYLLHGKDAAATDWEKLGNIQSVLDRLIADHQIRPMVVVMPSGGNSWYVDSADVKGPGNFATALSHDLPSAIEAAFPVGTDRAHRAIAGLSMGGYGALRFGLGAPDRYAAIAALSPAIWQNIPDDLIGHAQADLDRARTQTYFKKADSDDVTIGLDLPPGGSHFGAAFGSPFDGRRFNAANVFTLLEQAVEAKRALPSVFLTVGDDDSHLLWRGAIAFFETMQMDHRPIEFRVTDGDHNWTCWRGSLADAVLFVDRQFTRDKTAKEALR